MICDVFKILNTSKMSVIRPIRSSVEGDYTYEQTVEGDGPFTIVTCTDPTSDQGMGGIVEYKKKLYPVTIGNEQWQTILVTTSDQVSCGDPYGLYAVGYTVLHYANTTVPIPYTDIVSFASNPERKVFLGKDGTVYVERSFDSFTFSISYPGKILALSQQGYDLMVADQLTGKVIVVDTIDCKSVARGYDGKHTYRKVFDVGVGITRCALSGEWTIYSIEKNGKYLVKVLRSQTVTNEITLDYPPDTLFVAYNGNYMFSYHANGMNYIHIDDKVLTINDAPNPQGSTPVGDNKAGVSVSYANNVLGFVRGDGLAWRIVYAANEGWVAEYYRSAVLSCNSCYRSLSTMFYGYKTLEYSNYEVPKTARATTPNVNVPVNESRTLTEFYRDIPVQGLSECYARVIPTDDPARSDIYVRVLSDVHIASVMKQVYPQQLRMMDFGIQAGEVSWNRDSLLVRQGNSITLVQESNYSYSHTDVVNFKIGYDAGTTRELILTADKKGYCYHEKELLHTFDCPFPMLCDISQDGRMCAFMTDKRNGVIQRSDAPSPQYTFTLTDDILMLAFNSTYVVCVSSTNVAIVDYWYANDQYVVNRVIYNSFNGTPTAVTVDHAGNFCVLCSSDVLFYGKNDLMIRLDGIPTGALQARYYNEGILILTSDKLVYYDFTSHTYTEVTQGVYISFNLTVNNIIALVHGTGVTYFDQHFTEVKDISPTTYAAATLLNSTMTFGDKIRTKTKLSLANECYDQLLITVTK